MKIFDRLFCERRKASQTFIIPKGGKLLSEAFAAENESKYESAINMINKQVEKGNCKGLSELENFIKVNCPAGHELKYYEPGFRFYSEINADDAKKSIMKVASKTGILGNVCEIQSYLTVLNLSGETANMFNMLRTRFGFKEARSFELIYSHFILSAKFGVASTKANSHPDDN